MVFGLNGPPYGDGKGESPIHRLASGTAHPVSSPAQIAIVDDDIDVRQALEGLIISLGYTPSLFASAEEFLASPHRDEIACMILDVRMPGLTGLELQGALATQGTCPPIIFMTSYADASTRQQALSRGARGFFEKPVDADTLIECLESTLKKG